MNREVYRNQLGTTFHSKYRSIQTTVNCVTHRRCNANSVPKRVGLQGRAFGLRNSEMAFPCAVHTESVTCVSALKLGILLIVLEIPKLLIQNKKTK